MRVKSGTFCYSGVPAWQIFPVLSISLIRVGSSPTLSQYLTGANISHLYSKCICYKLFSSSLTKRPNNRHFTLSNLTRARQRAYHRKEAPFKSKIGYCSYPQISERNGKTCPGKYSFIWPMMKKKFYNKEKSSTPKPEAVFLVVCEASMNEP